MRSGTGRHIEGVELQVRELRRYSSEDETGERAREGGHATGDGIAHSDVGGGILFAKVPRGRDSAAAAADAPWAGGGP